ncbi:MFS transporter [Pelagicoccus albus]|uniref:MFS transporter n=1 Tax=Pelagicoccus albus TaxID=415222 RepID=A0A7X1E918_9BACT|nr:MFS transporter [Pelagicoccus albus]MBC2607340.1 MFS transporter [Pelagicoccus albus]
MKNSKLSVIEKLGFGAGDMSINVMVAALFYFMSYFYTDIFGLDPVHMATLFMVARFVDAFTDPMMGLITDKFKWKWGRFRPYFLILALPYGVSMMLLFTTPNFDYASKLIWAYATYLFATLMFTGVAIPYISYIGVLTSDTKERLSANGYRMTFAKIANAVIVFSVPILAKQWSGPDGDLGRGYQLAMGLMSGIGVLLLLACFFTTRERVEHKADKQPIGRQVALLLKNDQWLVLAAACIVGTLGYAVRGGVAIFYAKYYLGGNEWVQSSFMTSGIIAATISMVASTWITKKYCKVGLFRWSQILTGVISVLMYLVVTPDDIVMAFVFYVAISFVVDLHAPVFWSAIAEAVDYGHFKNGERVSGLAFGGISFCQKAGGAFAGLVVGLLLSYFGYEKDVVQSENTLKGIALMLTVIPGFFHALLGVMMYKYKITDQFYDNMVEESGILKPADSE